MAAELIKFGAPPPTLGGDAELQVAAFLRDELPEGYLLISSLSLPTRSSYFYEYDLVVISPFLCDVVDVKHLAPVVTVDEDRLRTGGGHEDALVFSSAQNKTRVLAEEIQSEVRNNYFAVERIWVELRIVLSDRCRNDKDVHFAYKDHQTNKRVLRLGEAVQYYTKCYRDAARTMNPGRLEGLVNGMRLRWRQRQERAGVLPRRNRLDRFQILRAWPSEDGARDYEAVDEPPCKVKVHLKERPFDPLLRGKELEIYLERVTKEMQLLRKLRHPYLCCVTGHFRTGSSLVQVSDWFDGTALDDLWGEMEGASLPEVLRLMTMLAQGLGYCHDKGIFHRHLDAGQVLVAPDWNDLRLSGFGFAKDVDRTGTVTTSEMKQRDPRLIPPEEIAGAPVENYRTYDIYQLGVLFYRMLENAAWPREAGTGVLMRELTRHMDECGIEAVRALVQAMLAEDPNERPDLMGKVEEALRNAVPV